MSMHISPPWLARRSSEVPLTDGGPQGREEWSPSWGLGEARERREARGVCARPWARQYRSPHQHHAYLGRSTLYATMQELTAMPERQRPLRPHTHCGSFSVIGTPTCRELPRIAIAFHA